MKKVSDLPSVAPRRKGEIEMKNAHLAAIVASSNDAISSFSLDGTMTSWNSAAERIFGYSADEIIGQTTSIFVPSELLHESTDIRERIRNGESIANYESVRLRRDGCSVPISMNISPIYDLTGAVVGVSVISRDITELKKSESQNILSAAIVATSNDAISSFSLDGIITSWNPAAERIFGYSADEIIGRPSLTFVPQERADESAEILKKIAKGQSIKNFETVRLKKDGSTVALSKTVSPIYDLNGAVIGASSITRDLTELKRFEAQTALLAAIVKSSTDTILSFSLNGIITSWNSVAERTYGYSAAEIIGQPLSILVPAEKASDVAKILEKIRNGRPILNYDTLRMTKDGRDIPVIQNLSPIFDSTGAVNGGSAICRDMTEIYDLEKRNKLLAIIVESSNDAIWSSTIDGIITSWNPAAERLYGYSAAEMIGQPFAVIAPSESSDETARLRELVTEGKPITNYEVERLRKDGTVVSVSLNISPIYDLSGAVIGASTITRDLTEFKRAEQKFQTIVESAPDAMVITDNTGIITLVNSKAEKIFGYRHEELLGQPVEILVPNQFPANELGPRIRNVSQILDQVRESGVQNDFYACHKDGREFPIEISLNQIEFSDGTHISITIRDVTAHKNLIRKLQDMNELRSEFVAIVAHDLRSPMTSISGYAQELLNQWDSTDDAEKIRYLQVIVRNTKHLAKFVEDVLQVARVEAGEYTCVVLPFDIRPLVQQALEDMAIESSGRQFEFSAPEDFPNVLGDRDRLRQVLTNLLSNAVKFSPADEPIVVRLSCTDKSVQVRVTDRGPGIAAEDMSKLFLKFGRLTNPRFLTEPGNGLGLYICKTLVEAQGGRIWCESSPGRGSTFIFTIPVAN